MASKLKFTKGCINQDNGRLIKAGDVLTDLSDFEVSRHLAEGNAVPVPDEIERAISPAPEKRKRRYTRKKKTNGDTV